MSSNHMYDQFRDAGGKDRGNGKPKFEIPKFDPFTGEPNPLYEELTETQTPKFETTKTVIVPETDLDKLNRFLITIGNAEIGIRCKILTIKKFLEVLGDNEIKKLG